MKMKNNPDLWASVIAWLAAHRSEGGYAFVAFLAAILRGVYTGESSIWRRLLDAAMCALVAFFISDILMIVGWDSKYANLGACFIGFFGIDYLSSMLRNLVSQRTGGSGAR